MPELKNCKRCNKVFPYLAGLQICQACTKEDEKIFADVSAYLRDNPGTPLSVVAEELGIGYDKLMKYVKEGRLIVRTQKGDVAHFCEKCGDMITEGKFCKSCESHIVNVLDTSKRSLQSKLEKTSQNNSGYRFLAADAKKKKS